MKRSKFLLKQVALEGLREELETMVALVKQVTKQTRARIFRGDTRTPGKILRGPRKIALAWDKQIRFVAPG